MAIKFVICVLLLIVVAALAVPLAQPGVGTGSIGGLSGGMLTHSDDPDQ